VPNVSPDVPFSLFAASALALILIVLFIKGRRRYLRLPSIPRLERPGGRLPDCMVVIPARNEEAAIGRVVRSLPPDTVIVVDDHSTDRTAEVAQAAGAGVLTAPELLRNAIGKANACAFGAVALTSRWVLFTDADTWFEPGFLDAAVASAETSGLALLSIYLDPEYEGIAEHALVPYARALAFTGLSMAGDPSALFRGQCLLVSREPYSFIGGHRAVISQLAEDLKLTMLAERHRLKWAIARGSGLGHVRMYEGYRGLRAGIRRHAYRFAMVSPVIGITILLAAFAATLWLPALAWLVWDRQWIAAGVFALLPTVILRSWHPSWWSAMLAPLAIYWILPVLIGGLVSAVFGKPVEWKGRTVRAVS
jgi:glycosyltransferase involved in cell wall biosynthesis